MTSKSRPKKNDAPDLQQALDEVQRANEQLLKLHAILNSIRRGEATLKYGDEGEAVTYVQRLLTLPATAVYDTATERAVKVVQRENGVKETGIVDSEMLERLEMNLTEPLVRITPPPREAYKRRGRTITKPEGVRARLKERDPLKPPPPPKDATVDSAEVLEPDDD